MIDFPIYVDIDASTYSIEHTATVLRSNFDSGFHKQRQASCAGFKRVQFEILIPGHRKNDFVDWWNSVGKGAIWFKFVDPETQIITRARLTSFNLQMQPQDAQFRKWRLPITLEIFDA